MHAVELEDVHVHVGGQHIIRGVTLNVPCNSVYVLMGPSGSGKTTLLRVINRLIDMVDGARVSGHVRVLGIDALKADPYALRRRVGMVSQIPNPFPHMTIYDNVAVAARINGVARGKREEGEVVEWALKKAMIWDEVKDRLHEHPHVLSGGQKQRLCLARALAMKAKVLLFDEPTANIDPVNARKLEGAISSLKDDATVIMVTHSPHQAARVADRVALIYEGRVLEEGAAKEVFLNPKDEFTVKFMRGEI
ncbi:MAG: phosphate ABC transporter ATP-binding protein [Candidatus Nezhaarchaeota archaeon]|nr:phosphate ABC transporter ATP-binding protein [Candidatus Nezhaarchaeota archaeon]